MKKQVSLLMTAAALVFMQGCNIEEMKVEHEAPHEDAFKVSIYSDIFQQPATKVTTDGFCSGDEVGVYLVNYDGETPGTLLVEDNQADNVRFTYNENGDWVSDYDIYYKDNETNVDMYGYYPYAEPSSIEAYPFEVARDQSKGAEHGQMAAYEASDFLWAKTKNVTPTASKVIMTFRHQMSSARVRFSQGTGWDDAAEYAAVTKEVLVTNTVRKSTINLATGVVTPEGEAPLTGIVPMKDYDEFRAIVVPQTVAAGQTLLTITIDGTPRHYSRDVDTEYVPGKITTYDLSISKKENTGEYKIELTGVSITAWEADNVSHGEDAREYVVVHNEIPRQLEKTIGERLEMDASKIKNLKLTGKITTEDYTFMRTKMTSLQRLNLKDVESIIDGIYSIPAGAFSGRSTLYKCILPDKLESIEYGAFASTSLSGTVQLPEGLKSIGGSSYSTGAFYKTKITAVYFPSSLEIIGNETFMDCSELRMELSLPESLKEIWSRAFASTGIYGTLYLPSTLEVIGESAFSYCTSLTGSLTIPDKITIVNGSAFSNCGFTGTLSLPKGLTKICSSAFYNVPFKGELNLPKGLLIIEDNAFYNGRYSGTLVIPDDLISIGKKVFMNCTRLTGVVEIPKNILSIPDQLFDGCSLIEGVKLHKDITGIGSKAFNKCYGICSIVSSAKTPPAISADSFNGVAKDNFVLEVPESSVKQYQTTNNWREFKRIAAHRDFSINRNLFRSLNDEISKTFLLRAPAGENWSVESCPEWVTVEPMSGTGKMDVIVTINNLAQGAGNRSGEIKFLLDGKDYRSTMTVEQYDYQYGDGDMITLQEAGTGNGVNIVIMGDCFDAKDISEGKYLKAMQDAYSYFFDIEPYLTYKDYFNVYGVFGMSPDSGMGTVNTIREARFGSQYTLNAGLSPDFERTFAAACVAPINNDVSRTLVIMIENSSEYSGLCYMWGDGSAVAIVPMSTDPEPYDFRGLIHHEAGGHGFGKLADEYIYHNSFIQNCESCGNVHIEPIQINQSYGFYQNVSLTGDWHSVPWSHLCFDLQYSNIVDVYEGAYMHTRGIYRSEATSCMNNNIPYYNAISREEMVKRIKKYAGEEYSFEDFKANDKESLPSVMTKSDWMWSEGTGVSSRFDHMPPKFMGEKPSFNKNAF